MASYFAGLRRRRSARDSGSQIASVALLEPRILPSVTAGADSATLGTNQSYVEIDVLANDSSTMGTPAIYSQYRSGSYGYVVPNSTGDKLVYYIGNVGSEGEKDGVVTAVNTLITTWENRRVDEITQGYEVAMAALGRLRTFIADSEDSSTNTWLVGAIAAAYTTGGSVLMSTTHEIAGTIFGVVSAWALLNPGASNTDTLNAMQDGLLAKRNVEINAARAAATAERTAFATLQSGLGNPPTMSVDYIEYTVTDWMDSDTGDIFIDLSNRPNYRAIIDALTAHKDAITPAMETFYGWESSVTNIYAELLKNLNQAIGGNIYLIHEYGWYYGGGGLGIVGWHAYWQGNRTKFRNHFVGG